ncbi:hypothetical protein [uncultured Deinococcus sp.]|uniref:hypothetical protein n=1 Tax=uncultured Deinococcus sp. TaxID=158789 RepID=UPI0025896E6A|nr:hypothetical protein [uncultured Deinococcus sp.]
MRPLMLALALAASCALAGGGDGPATGSGPAFDLFPQIQRLGISPTGTATVPFEVRVDLLRATFRPDDGTLVILVTQALPDGTVLTLDSRPVRPGEKLRWTGRLPAAGTLVLRVVTGQTRSTSLQEIHPGQPVVLDIVGDVRGRLSISDGRCTPPPGGSCGRSR